LVESFLLLLLLLHLLLRPLLGLQLCLLLHILQRCRHARHTVEA